MPSSAAVARTRVSIPPRPATAISRAAALARLDEAAAHPIIALVAGPGSGKTMLLSEWAATRPTAWYEASEEDDDPAVFAAHVHAA
ncbi:MAG: hypothetical protein FJX76_14570, partial [Armatimonadetes bacterium]|nr:hypothetical protein [Armatimonadota bacterium]